MVSGFQSNPLRGLRITEVAPSASADDDALPAAAKRAIAGNVPLIVDRPVILTRIWTPPPGLILKGDGTLNATVKCTGRGDGIEISSPIEIDGITIDGGLAADADRSIDGPGCLIGFHGQLTGSPSYLSGVKIGYLRVRRARTLGLVMANLVGLQAQTIDLEDIYSNAFMMSGVSDSSIGTIRARNIGTTARAVSRHGSAIAIFSASKPVSTWYDMTSRIMPTRNLTISTVDIAQTTDSAVYIHDGLKTGVNHITFGSVLIDTAGKDGFKTRLNGTTIRADKVVTRRTSLRGVDIESDDVVINQIDISDVGFDAVGAILGHPANFSGGDLKGESVQEHPVGLVVMDCSGISLGSVRISNVAASPVSQGEGAGIYLNKAKDVKASGTIANCDGNGIRIAGSTNFDLNFSVSNTCRIGKQKQAILVSPDGVGPSQNGNIRGSVRQPSGGTPITAVYVPADCCNIRDSVSYSKTECPGGIRNMSGPNC